MLILHDYKGPSFWKELLNRQILESEEKRWKSRTSRDLKYKMESAYS